MGSLNLVGTAAVLTLILTCPACYGVASQHPDCRDPNVGSSKKLDDATCHWKYYRATDDRDTELNNYGTCIACYYNACFNPNSDRCRKKCNKYWNLCVNYTIPVQTGYSTTVYPSYTSVSNSARPQSRPAKEGGKTSVGDSTSVVPIVVPVAVVVVLAPVLILSVVWYRRRQANTNNEGVLHAQNYAPPQQNEGGEELDAPNHDPPQENEGRVEIAGVHIHTHPQEERKAKFAIRV